MLSEFGHGRFIIVEIPWYDGLDRFHGVGGLWISALLPINGRRPERKVSATCGGMKLPLWQKNWGWGCVILCHYDMFTFNTESPKLFTDHCRALNQPFKVLPNRGTMVILAE